MDTDLTKAQRFRDQAQKMRYVADKESNPEVKKAMLELALMYDRLCQLRLGPK
jgi:hypothetical protein